MPEEGTDEATAPEKLDPIDRIHLKAAAAHEHRDEAPTDDGTVVEPEDEQEDEPAGEADVTHLVMEANHAYIGQVAEIFGSLDGIKQCPYCNGLGFDALELPADPTVTTCGRCNGYGNVTTGSKVDGNQTRLCTLCNGSGFTSVQQEGVEPQSLHAQHHVVPVVPHVPLPIAG